MPSFSVGVVKPSALVGIGSGNDGGGAIGGAAASSLTTKRSGFEGLEMRPLLYEIKLVGVQDVGHRQHTVIGQEAQHEALEREARAVVAELGDDGAAALQLDPVDVADAAAAEGLETPRAFAGDFCDRVADVGAHGPHMLDFIH